MCVTDLQVLLAMMRARIADSKPAKTPAPPVASPSR
jgi:hypothetical protein